MTHELKAHLDREIGCKSGVCQCDWKAEQLYFNFLCHISLFPDTGNLFFSIIGSVKTIAAWSEMFSMDRQSAQCWSSLKTWPLLSCLLHFWRAELMSISVFCSDPTKPPTNSPLLFKAGRMERTRRNNALLPMDQFRGVRTRPVSQSVWYICLAHGGSLGPVWSQSLDRGEERVSLGMAACSGAYYFQVRSFGLQRASPGPLKLHSGALWCHTGAVEPLSGLPAGQFMIMDFTHSW